MYILQSFALPADSRTSAPRGSLLQEPFASVQASNIQASNTHVMQHKYINIQLNFIRSVNIINIYTLHGFAPHADSQRVAPRVPDPPRISMPARNSAAPAPKVGAAAAPKLVAAPKVVGAAPQVVGAAAPAPSVASVIQHTYYTIELFIELLVLLS